MHILRIAILCSVMTGLAPTAQAANLITQVRVSMETYAIRATNDDTPSRVIFTGSPVRGEIALIAAALPSGTAGPASIQLPSEEWWQHLKWSVRQNGNADIDVHPKWFATNATGRLRAGERVLAKFELGQLPPGEYRLSVGLDSMRSEVEWFLVSNGTETADLRREFARYKVDRSSDPETLRVNLLALAAADPLNAGPWIRLGDLALAKGTVEEIRGYYDRAARVLEQRRSKFAADSRQDVVEKIDAQLEVVVAVRELIAYYVTNRGTLILHADGPMSKRYLLRDRMTGRVVRTIPAIRSAKER